MKREEFEFILQEGERLKASIQRSFDNLDLLNISILDCLTNSLSLEIIAALNFNANAKKSISFGCSGRSSNASGILSEYSKNEMNFTVFCNLILNSSNSTIDNLVFVSISDLCLSNSSKANSGERSSCSFSNNFFINDPFQKKLNNEFVSNTSFIYIIPCSFNFFNLSCLASSPSLCASSSVNSDFINFVSRNSASESLCIKSVTALLNTSDQFIVLNESISCFNFSGTDTVTLGILSSHVFTQKTQNLLLYKSFVKQKIYKYFKLVYFSSLQITSMIPGDLQGLLDESLVLRDTLVFIDEIFLDKLNNHLIKSLNKYVLLSESGFLNILFGKEGKNEK